MSNYLQCEGQAKLIGQKFHELLKKDNSYQQKFYLEYSDLKTIPVQAPILILGLNPAGEDDLNIGRTLPNLFSYIPQNPAISEELGQGDYDKLKQFCYSKYFKTFVEMFQKLDPPYNPLWYNTKVLQQIFNNNTELAPELMNYFGGYKDNENYIVFADLVQYSKTNSKEIIPLLSDETVINLIKEYLKVLLDFIKPKMVLVANAAVSHFIIKHYNDDKVATLITINETKVFLASMLTGSGAMDIYSRQRLFIEIQDFLSIQ